MKSFILLLIFSFPLCLAMQCDPEKDKEPSPDCPEKIIISKDSYINAPDDDLSIIKASISGDCITIGFTSSGCDGSTWELMLVDADIVMESYPPQRNLRLSLSNKEDCDAVITQEVSFDLRPLQLDYDKIWLNLTNSGDQLLYDY